MVTQPTSESYSPWQLVPRLPVECHKFLYKPPTRTKTCRIRGYKLRWLLTVPSYVLGLERIAAAGQVLLSFALALGLVRQLVNHIE